MFNVQAPIISLSGLIESVVTGLTTAIVLGVCAWIKLLRDRRKQVNHLRHLLSLGYERIVRESGFHGITEIDNPFIICKKRGQT